MGCDTGFEPYNEPFYENIRAGCEFGDVDIDMKATVEEARHYMSTVPRIFKAPDWSWKLKTFLGRGYVDIEYVILPFRDFDEAAKHAAMFGRVMEAAYLFRLPLTIIRYPDLVQSADYCYQRLTPIFDFDYDLFKEKHEELSWE
jgi:hypothetical protein